MYPRALQAALGIPASLETRAPLSRSAMSMAGLRAIVPAQYRVQPSLERHFGTVSVCHCYRRFAYNDLNIDSPSLSISGFPSSYDRYNGVYERLFELPFSTEHGGGAWNEILFNKHAKSFDVLFTTRGTAAVEGITIVAIFRIDEPLTDDSSLVAARVTFQELIQLSGLNILQILTSDVFSRLGFIGFLPHTEVHRYWELKEYSAIPSFKASILTPTPSVSFVAGKFIVTLFKHLSFE